jgi:phosphoribosylformylglycinamidine cyclo-ligase
VQTTEELAGFPRMLDVLRATFALRGDAAGRPALDFGYYANVLDLGNNTGLAISTDGVGTKIMVAEAMGKYDTIGIDCVAMNVNDVICVGAEPIAMTDYVAVQEADPEMLSQLAIGLKRGAELAQSHPRRDRAVAGDGHGIDRVGTCVGLVPWTGSSPAGCGPATRHRLRQLGIHSNGLTLARECCSRADSRL